MKAVTFVLTFLAFASYVLAACNSASATTCDANYNKCIAYTNIVPTCECTITYMNCMTTAGCCSTTNTSDSCDTKCNANCADASCAWPPPLADNCANGGACLGMHNCGAADCECEVALRQCLLFQGCTYSATLSAACSSNCTARTPTPDCSAKSASISPSGSCVANPPYIPAGDCTCRDDIRNIVRTATCAAGTWTVAGPYTLSTTLLLQNDVLKVNGNFTIASNGNLAFSFSSNADAGKVAVTGAATIQGPINVEITNMDTTPKTITLLTATSVSVPNMNVLRWPSLGTGLCLVSRSYNTPTVDIQLSYQVSTNASDCTIAQPPPATPVTPAVSTTGVAPRPTPVKYVPPPMDDSVSALSIFASVALLVATLVAKLF